jgi:hypothetical protein
MKTIHISARQKAAHTAAFLTAILLLAVLTAVIAGCSKKQVLSAADAIIQIGTFAEPGNLSNIDAGAANIEVLSGNVYDVVGSLCENCDKFAVQRSLPKIDTGEKNGDLVIIHDAGAHGRAMGFNYNAKLRSGELLLRPDGTVTQIRRRETIEDYFATLDFAGLDSFTV